MFGSDSQALMYMFWSARFMQHLITQPLHGSCLVYLVLQHQIQFISSLCGRSIYGCLAVSKVQRWTRGCIRFSDKGQIVFLTAIFYISLDEKRAFFSLDFTWISIGRKKKKTCYAPCFYFLSLKARTENVSV